MRQVGIDAFQTLLLPDIDRERSTALNHDVEALQAVRLDVLPEIEWGWRPPSQWRAPAGRACWPESSRSIVDSGAPRRRRRSD
jgi:hypothetical protein